MRKQFLKTGAFLLMASAILVSCSNDDAPVTDDDNGGTSGKYVLLTAEWQVSDGSGYYATYSDMPTGDVDNIEGYSIQARNFGGFRHYKNWVFSRANLAGEVGILRYSVASSGRLEENGFIKCGTSAQHIVVDETTGFYFDGNRGKTKVQKFNPSTMQRTGEIDLSSAVETGTDISNNVFTGIQTLAAKEGKLYVSVTYSRTNGSGNLDNTRKYTLAVVDIVTGVLEKTIVHPKAKNHGYAVSEYPAWIQAKDGTLYFMTVGWDFDESNVMQQQNSFIFRIKAGETDFDPNWELNTSDLGLPDGALLWSFRELNGKLYIDASQEATSPLLPNLNTNIYGFYAVDIETKNTTQITDVPLTVFGLSTGNVEVVDDQVFLRVINRPDGINAYYKVDLEDNTASPAFNVTRGGEASGFIRLANE
ncbi:hypothetical protein ED312_14490 [Sinomicrobium pectinilyticum]|uniref:DUF4374 domain-containing protein n=1 Tax=Sinomicrobium pectinilyticum TaxID=1084421 RepID=A0A3N0E7Y5_SINP1|nr:hypothetical protein [Sinomicrobium pectinilyticum]RNL83913.1 hypothetical protein ED312_14490 [Sinomicrobium pectinilyticum]